MATKRQGVSTSSRDSSVADKRKDGKFQSLLSSSGKLNMKRNISHCAVRRMVHDPSFIDTDVCCLCQIWSHVCSFSRTRDTMCNHCQPLPTILICLEPMSPWELFVKSWICFINRSCLDVTTTAILQYLNLKPLSVGYATLHFRKLNDVFVTFPLATYSPNKLRISHM